MNPWAAVLAQLAIALLAVVLQVYADIKTRFAPDEASAWRGLKAAAIKTVSAIFSLLLVALLAWNVFRPGPPTRLDVFLIAFQIMNLGLIGVVRVLERLSEVQRRHMLWTGWLLEHVSGSKDDAAKAKLE